MADELKNNNNSKRKLDEDQSEHDNESGAGHSVSGEDEDRKSRKSPRSEEEEDEQEYVPENSDNDESASSDDDRAYGARTKSSARKITSGDQPKKKAKPRAKPKAKLAKEEKPKKEKKPKKLVYQERAYNDQYKGYDRYLYQMEFKMNEDGTVGKLKPVSNKPDLVDYYKNPYLTTLVTVLHNEKVEAEHHKAMEKQENAKKDRLVACANEILETSKKAFDGDRWKNWLINDFEKAFVNLHREVVKPREKFRFMTPDEICRKARLYSRPLVYEKAKLPNLDIDEIRTANGQRRRVFKIADKVRNKAEYQAVVDKWMPLRRAVADGKITPEVDKFVTDPKLREVLLMIPEWERQLQERIKEHFSLLAQDPIKP